MNGDRVSTSTAIGLCLLPSELLHEIFCRLALPELIRLRSVSRPLGSLVSGDDFRRLYELRSGSVAGWVFVYKKRPPRDSVLRGFNDRSGRWFQIPVAEILAPAVPPGEDIYFLAASGDFFLFASNGLRELVAVNLETRAVRKIPASPLGPRGTSSWRRSGLKLVSGPSGSGRFRFLFAELYQNRPVLFDYCSEANTWQVTEAASASRVERADRSYLNVAHSGSESVVLSAGRRINDVPVVFRPRFVGGSDAAGGIASDRLHVYGDGNMAVVRSAAVDEGCGRGRARVATSVEVWGMSWDGREWELVSRVPEVLMERIRGRPYGVMMGCIEERREVIRLVLMSNLKGSWDLIWLSYGRVGREWVWVPVPDCGTHGLNLAGIALSSSFGGLRPPSSRTVQGQLHSEICR